MNRNISFRLSTIFLLGILAIAPGPALAADAPRLTLNGSVIDFSGEPMKGARVYLYSARPKDAPRVSNGSSSYPDCAKRATTDAQGKFKIEGLDPNLLFRVLVAGKEHAPKFMPDVDPEEDPIEVYLQPSLGEGEPRAKVRGRVLDGEGKPVSGAVITTRGVTRNQSTRFGGNRDVDAQVVSDDDGLFEIRGETEFDAVGVEVEGRGLAKGIFTSLAAGDKVHDLKLNRGATVKGRLVRDGKPVSGVEVGISGADRSAEIYVGNFKEPTDKDGRFEFGSLPAKTAYQLYGIMKSFAESGALSTRPVMTEAVGSTNDLGDLPVGPAYVVEGQVRLKDGTAPPFLRLNLSREEAWDSQQTEIDDDGRFRFAGVPSEVISISARLRGYRLSTKNASLDPLNPFHLVGRIPGNKTNLVIEIEPGENHQRLDGDYQAVRDEPLQGAEAPAKLGEIKISGKVVDAESGEPLPVFTTTEGRSGDWPPEQITWFTTRKAEQTNGTFTIYFTKQQRAPAILVEAEDHLPFSTGPISALETNLTIALKRGSGIEGIVRNPAGEPVAGAKVYLTDMREGVYVQGPPFEVRDNVYRGTKSIEADEKGHFKFPAQVDAYAVIVVDESGYGEVKIEELAKTREVRLKPYAAVKGKLMIGTKPGANESVRLSMANLLGEHHPRHFPPLNMYLTTTTDADGDYLFDRVAPVPAEVYHEPKVRESRMGTIAMSQGVKMVLEPGKTHEVNLGGRGRPVIGKMVVKGYDGEIKWRADVHSIETVLPPPEGLPDHAAFFADLREKMAAARSPEEQQKTSQEMQKRSEEFNRKQREFYQTEEGRKYHFARSRYALNFKEDGTFRIEDVPGGKYMLRMDLREGGDDMRRFQAPPIGFVQKEIEVPDSPGGRTDEPFDLGTIELLSRTAVRPGVIQGRGTR
jgi:protocatechuate 3,4-dioxygenase beta subunit